MSNRKYRNKPNNNTFIIKPNRKERKQIKQRIEAIFNNPDIEYARKETDKLLEQI